MRFGIIFNPAAGRRTARRPRHQIEAFCAQANIGLKLVVLDRLDRIEAVAQRLVPEVDMLGIVGGDGSLNAAVNGIMMSAHPETPLAFFPAGRGKDVARTLSSWNPGELRRRTLAYQFRRIDVGVVDGIDARRFFVNETSVGIGALAARSATKLPRMFGTSSYLAGTASALVTGRPFSARIALNDGEIATLRRCHHITIANGRYFGGGLQIAPPADPEDGLLEVVAVADVGAITIAKALPRLFQATHLTHPAVRYWRARDIRIETEPEALVESEGEVWTSTPLTISVAKQALTWVEPA